MEGDDIIQRQVSKFQKISCNVSSVISDSSSNPNKIGTHKGNHLFPVGDGGGSGGDCGGVGRLVGWPSSRIVRVSRASGGKDRHSKVLTSKGLRDRRIRLSVSTAIEFYDLQDRLGYDQPSKAVEWLINAASSSIDELPSLDPSFPGGGCGPGGTDNHHQERQLRADNINKSVEHDTDFEDPNHQHHHHQSNNNNNSNSNSNNNNACSSTSDTSKGSGLSLSRSENRIRARERARDLAAKKETVKESAISSSFTDLLTGGININNNLNPHMDYFQMPQFNNIPNQHQQEHQPQNHHYTFLQGNYAPGAGGLASSGLNRGTLQSNLLSSLPNHQQQQHNNNNLQRTFQQATMVDGSASANFPFFMAPTISSGGPDHFQAAGYDPQRLQLYGGGRHSDHYKEKSKN